MSTLVVSTFGTVPLPCLGFQQPLEPQGGLENGQAATAAALPREEHDIP
jgi:hypothetical protein